MDTAGKVWWSNLEPQWREAFSCTFFQRNTPPSADELAQLQATPALRFAGPQAFYPNLSFELTNLSGIQGLLQLETLVVTNHQLQSLEELRTLTALRNLFVQGNKIRSLQGIENLTGLEMLYVQDNLIDSLAAITNLTNLKELYINNNQIASLDGLTEAHADKLENFFCKPNEFLKQKELLRVEREIGIRCRSV